jgi:hypothetical protein
MTRTEEITYIVDGLEEKQRRYEQHLRGLNRSVIKISSQIDSVCRILDDIEAEIKEYGAEQLNINLAT